MPVKRTILDAVLRRRTLRALMDTYERNYRLIVRLMPEPEQCGGVMVSDTGNGPALYMRIEEQSRYTTTLFMTHYLRIDGEIVEDPGITVRVYHDAGQAEVMSCRLQGFMPMDEERRRSSTILDCKSESNIFLLKWLEHLVAAGHAAHTLKPEQQTDTEIA